MPRFFAPSNNIAAAKAAYVEGDGPISTLAGSNQLALVSTPTASTTAFRDLTSAGFGNGYSTTSGKTLAVLPSIGRCLLLYVRGQSNCGNVSGATAYTPANPNALFNINPFDGLTYKLADPILGADGSGASFVTRAADALVSHGVVDTVTVVNIAVGGTSAADWASGGVCYQRIAAAVSVVRQTGFVPWKTMWWHHQGESNTASGTATFNNYLSPLSSALAQCAALTPSAIQFVGRVTFYNSSTSSAIKQAQAAVVDNRSVFDLGDFDTIDCTGRSVGCIDYNTNGNIAAAATAAASTEAYLNSH